MATNTQSSERIVPFTCEWSRIGLILMLLTITIVAQVPMKDLALDFGNLKGTLVPAEFPQQSPIEAIATIAAIVAVLVITTIAIRGLLTGNTNFESSEYEYMLNHGPLRPFLYITGQEAMLRYFPLQICASLNSPIATRTTLFIVSFLLLGCFRLAFSNKRNKRTVASILITELISCLAFTYIMSRYGIYPDILAYLVFFAIEVSAHKEKPINGNIVKIIYYMGIGLFTWCLGEGILRHHLTDFAAWMSGDIGPLSFYSLIDYLIVFIGIDCAIGVLGNVLMLDTLEMSPGSLKDYMEKGLGYQLKFLFLLGLFSAGIILLLNWLLSLAHQDIPARVIIITAIMCLVQKTTSGSAFARIIIIDMPETLLITCAYVILGFWAMFLLSIIFFLLNLFPRLFDTNLLSITINRD